ncbi:acid phosphatase [[Pantoea] beijingensis]|uniref:Acid phosphatase n=1 Tax=[Pantoea] beijingensis TaxID=1324864 RepID=A0A443I9D7_9GAMM|nr:MULTISPECIES: acid phosphatase PhoC [Erwiniaceae]RWR00722.1 acid phosphatase [[Pantoea] beijingensis]
MKKSVIAFCFTSLFSVSTLALVPGGNDATTKPDLYYLNNNQAIDSLALLPPPPEVGSVAFLNDQAMYEKGRLLRSSERGRQAAEDANLSGGGVANAFSAAFGSPITPQDAPELHKLLTNMIEDAGDLATRSAKEKYMRIRPFAFYGAATCNTKEQDKLAKNGSYPSGHTSIGWATALVLAEINPQRQDQILKRGYALGQSRVICGYHWQSDVDAARIVGSAVVATLHTNPAFLQQLQKAKDEFSRTGK